MSIDHLAEHPTDSAPSEPAGAPEGAAEAQEASQDTQGGERLPQGRIGWLRLRPDDDCRYLMREVPGYGWTRIDTTDRHLVWPAEGWPDAEFTPIRTLADDEVAVKRGVLDNAAARLRGVVTVMDPSEVAIAHEAADTLTQAKIISDALEAGR